MDARNQSVLFGVLYTLMCAIGGGVGIATLLASPFGNPASAFIGVTYVISAVICWMWACFARELFK
jgi:hypothetical protein